MSCTNALPIDSIAADVRDALSDEFVRKDRPIIDNGILSNPTLKAPSIRGDLILDSEARDALIRATGWEYDKTKFEDAIDEVKQEATTAIGTAADKADKAAADAGAAIQDLFESGGVPARPFSTYEDMVSPAVNPPLLGGDYAVVLNDDELDKNGYYEVSGGEFVFIKYNPLAQARLEIAASQKFFAEKTTINDQLFGSGQSLLSLTDSEGKPYLLVDGDGGLKLVGLSGTVQHEVTRLSGSIIQSGNAAILEIHDANDLLVAQVTEGDIKMAGAPDGIIHMAKGIGERIPESDNTDFKIMGAEDSTLAVFTHEGDIKVTSIPDGIATRLTIDFLSKELGESNNDAKYDIHPSALAKITTLQMQTGVRAPIPLGAVPLDFTPPPALLGETIVQPLARTPIDTPYRTDDGVVHPYVVQFADTFNHKKYWLGVTPYYLNEDKFENPVVYGSDDLQEFKMFDDYPQPLAENPPAPIGYKHAYNSDIFHFYDFSTGDLCCGWRLTEDKLPTGREVSLLYKRTKDGINWSGVEVLMPKTLGDIALSPSVIYDFNAKRYYLYVVTNRAGGSGYKLGRYETNRIGGEWSNVTACVGIETTGITPWHADVRYLGDSIVALVQDNFSAQNFCLALSEDGVNFTAGPPLLTGEYTKPYKGTLTFSTNDANQISLTYIWTTNEKTDVVDDRWRLYTQQTNFVNII